MTPEYLDTLYRFFFQPEALSVYFLYFLGAVFFFGIYRVVHFFCGLRHKLEAISVSYVEARNNYKIDPIKYIELNLDDDYVTSKVTSIPGLLVTVGILGTFIGLGVSIKYAAASMGSMENALPSMNTLMSTVAFKFQTSTWGIVGSIFFQLTFVNFFRWKKEKLLEARAHTMLDDYRPASVTLLDTLDQSIGNFVRNLSASVSKMEKVTTLFHSGVSDFQKEVTQTSAQQRAFMEDLASLSQKLTGAIDEMGKGVSYTLKSELKRLAEASEKLNSRMAASLDETTRVVTELNTGIKAREEGIKEQLETSNKYANSMQSGLVMISKTMSEYKHEMAQFVDVVNRWEARVAADELSALCGGGIGRNVGHDEAAVVPNHIEKTDDAQ